MIYKWIFPSLECYSLKNEKKNVVFEIEYQYHAYEGEHFAFLLGKETLPLPNGEFIEFDNLTQEIVEGWLEASLGNKLDLMKTELQEMINEKKSPNKVKLVPPWHK